MLLEVAKAIVFAWLVIKSIEFLGGRLAQSESFKRKMEKKYSGGLTSDEK